MSLCLSKVSNKLFNRGFSLIELMVTIAIVMLITGVSLVRYGSFNNSVLLKSQAFELALDIREAQLFGVSVSRGDTGNFRGAYGVHFNLATPNVYRLFQDADDDDRYDADEVIGDSFTIDPRFVITEIATDTGCTGSEASIAFRRPNFSALQHVTDCPANPMSVTIHLATAADVSISRTVTVYQTGLITVD